MTSAVEVDTVRTEPDEPRALRLRLPAAVVALAMALTGGHLLVAGWVDASDGGIHRMHDLCWGVAEGLLLAVPLALTAWRPVRHTAALRVALLALAAQLVVGVATLTPDPFAIVLVVLGALLVWGHPARAVVLRPARRSHGALAWLLAGAVLIAAAVLAAVQVAHHLAAAPDDPLRVRTGWIGAALCWLAVGAVAAAGLLLRDRTALVLSSCSLLVLGAGSITFPTVPSSLGVTGGAAAVAVGLALALRARARRG